MFSDTSVEEDKQFIIVYVFLYLYYYQLHNNTVSDVPGFILPQNKFFYLLSSFYRFTDHGPGPRVPVVGVACSLVCFTSSPLPVLSDTWQHRRGDG